MAISQEDILNAVAEMSVKDVVELISAMEEKFGVTAAVAAAGPAAAGEAAAEQTEFDVILTAAGEKNVKQLALVLKKLKLWLTAFLLQYVKAYLKKKLKSLKLSLKQLVQRLNLSNLKFDTCIA